MKIWPSILLAAIVVAMPLSVCRADSPRVVKSFVFNQTKSAEWIPGGVVKCSVTGDMLKVSTVAEDNVVMGPLIDIKADARQYIEITMQSSVDATHQIFYTNTTEEPYGGMRGDWRAQFQIKKGGMRVYTLFPHWSSLGKIIRLRLSPPAGTFSYKSIRIMQAPDGQATNGVWKASKPSTWSVLGTYKSNPNGILATGELKMMSPMLTTPTAKLPWMSLMVKSTGAQQAIAQWTTSEWKEPRTCVFPLKSDGLWHSYNVSVEPLADWTGVLNMLTLNITSPDGKPTEVRLFGASAVPLGDAELSAPQFIVQQNFVRIGQTADIAANVINLGGTPSKAQKLSIRMSAHLPKELVPGTVKLKDAAVMNLPSIKPGQTIKVNWALTPLKAGSVKFELMTAGHSAPIATSLLQINPARPTLPQGQIPPVVAPKSDYDVGVYYFPGWFNYSRWSVLNDYPERSPVLGYYREGEPEVADWHIKWMAEHGINFIIYDWYWNNGSRSLEHALHNGLFNADLRNQMKFCLLWANHNPEGTSSEDDLIKVTQYWLDNYFLRPEYYKIDGKPVMVIFAPRRFTDDIGVEAVKRSFEKMRRMCQEKGLPGLYLVACSGPSPNDIKLIDDAGYDAISGYNYPSAGTNGELRAPYDVNIKGYEGIWKSIAKSSTLRYIPVTDPGWDSRPWHGANAMVRTDKAPYKFEKMLDLAKQFVDTEHAKEQRKVVFVEAWNELGEGDAIEPTRDWGFGYLDAIRRVFTPNAGPHIDVVPEDVGMGPYNIKKPVSATSWDFNDPKNPGWEVLFSVSDFKVQKGMISGLSENYDPSFASQVIDVEASKVKAIVIKMHVSAGKEAQLYWTAPGGSVSEAASVRFNLKPGSETQTYRLDMKANPRWKGNIAGFRFDPTDASQAKIDIYSINLELAK